MTRTEKPQVLILGTGIAGLSLALRLAEHAHVTLVCKTDRLEGSTRYAQGGIASVWSHDDSFEDHIRDTLVAGAGLCKSEVVNACVREGPKRVSELMDWGVKFTKNEMPPADPAEAFDLHREGGHGKRRILHVDDLTGLAIMNALLAEVDRHPDIKILENCIAIDLVTEAKIFKRKKKSGRCLGAYVLNTVTGEVLGISAHVTVLATGGAGKVYLYTSNPDTATGDGIAMASRAGALVSNLEFMQFHPTCLFNPSAKNFLISEALRGEGAVLRNARGEDFVKAHHPEGSLAPRDVVARAIDIEMKRTGEKHVWLDATHLPSEMLKEKFPNISRMCQKFGIDMATQPIPVVPAAHYMCGGVLVDANSQTSVENLYAVGEVSCTGLHGANRLASNSLLEAVVFAARAGDHIIPKFSKKLSTSSVPDPLPEWDTLRAVALEDQIDIASNWDEVRTLMWNYVGIVRSNQRLERARRRLDLIKNEVNQLYWKYLLTKDLIELRNIIKVAELIVQCAGLRKESRGLHCTVNYPEKNDRFYAHDTVI